MPRYVAIVESFDAIGMTASGKVQKNKLREHAIERFKLGTQAPAPQPDDGDGAMSDVVLCECFARDGLQHETEFVPTDTKRALIERFAALGFRRVEATSYSNPKVVPQFADASELLARCRGARASTTRRPAPMSARSSARSPISTPGFGVTEISLLVSASEAHSMKNLRAVARRPVGQRRAAWQRPRRAASA